MPDSAQDVVAVVVEEAMSAREELGETVAEAVEETRGGLSAIAAGGACGLLAALTAHSAVQQRLAKAWSPELAAGALTLAYATGATALFRYGQVRLRRAREASRDTLEVTRDTVARTVEEIANS
ncbi:phage holin family protein [Streptomyces lichenis]|uniref:Phage holin family protein n=1 Tax=Streptomyces lichenis TaxID=2306967 RepID=A0ABT0I8L6_9ACTN|nr:phage holin family protein [Streptomyces lichenis]MCK8677666.1 phage holin family protein [Streptomyces lichenis]